MKPRLSVIVTAYNIEKYIVRALCSIVDQGFENLELILIDDGSSDRTVELAGEFLRGEPNARIVLQANSGPGAARNVGIELARGDYVIFLDGDDWFAPKALDALWSATESGVDLVLSNRRRYWEKSGQYTTKPVFTEGKVGSVGSAPEVMKIYAIHGKMFKRSVFSNPALRFPTGMSSEDFVFSYMVYAAIKSVAIIKDVTYIYRKRNDGANQSLTQARLSDFNLTSRFKQIEMTLDVVETSALKKRFPKINFQWLEFQARLMRHVKVLPRERDHDRKLWAFEQLQAFLTKHETAALANCRADTRKIYELIIGGRFEDAHAAILAYELNDRAEDAV